jgi:hypothetical protein
MGTPRARLNQARRITAEGTVRRGSSCSEEDGLAELPGAQGEPRRRRCAICVRRGRTGKVADGMEKGAAAAVGRRTGATAAVGTGGCAAAGRGGEWAPGCWSCRRGPR